MSLRVESTGYKTFCSGRGRAEEWSIAKTVLVVSSVGLYALQSVKELPWWSSG